MKIIIKENDANQRLDRFLRKYFLGSPLSLIYKNLRQKQILINNKVVTAHSHLLKVNDVVDVQSDSLFKHPKHNIKKRIAKKYKSLPNLEIIFENEEILIINKDNIHSVHGFDDCLDNIVLSYLSPNLQSLTFKPTHVHRLDRHTTGCIIYAKTAIVARLLNKYIRLLKKEYLAVIEGKLHESVTQQGYLQVIDKRVEVVDNNKYADEFKQKIIPLMIEENFTLIKIELLTGKKHQIRAGLAHMLNTPIVGDLRYGNMYSRSPLLLHARKIEFPNSLIKELNLPQSSFTAPIPQF